MGKIRTRDETRYFSTTVLVDYFCSIFFGSGVSYFVVGYKRKVT